MTSVRAGDRLTCMAQPLGPALPVSRLAQLGPAAAPDRTLVLPLCTVDEAGFPHVALLGVWEVVAWDAATVRFAVAGRSGTAANLRRTGRATLIVLDGAGAHYVKLRVREAAAAMRDATWNARFEGLVQQVLADAADPEREGASHLVHGSRRHRSRPGTDARRGAFRAHRTMTRTTPRRLIVGITGASGDVYGVRLLGRCIRWTSRATSW